MADFLTKRASLALIREDTVFFRDFGQSGGHGAFWPIAHLAVLPFLATYIYESGRYLSKEFGSNVSSADETGQLERSRMRIKLTRDRFRSASDVLEELEKLTTLNREWFYEEHSGVLGGLKRAIQPDLGLFFLGKSLVTTTHVALFNMGISLPQVREASLSLANLGIHLKQWSTDLGHHVRMLLDSFELDSRPDSPPKFWDPAIEYADMKSERLYRRTTRLIAPNNPHLAILTFWIISVVNAARLIVPVVSESHPVTSVKIRFLSAFQVVEVLNAVCRDNSVDLTGSARRTIHGLLGEAPIRDLMTWRQLRNTFVHYGVPDSFADQLVEGDRLYGLVEALTKGEPLNSVQKTVDLTLESLSGQLETLIPFLRPVRRLSDED